MKNLSPLTDIKTISNPYEVYDSLRKTNPIHWVEEMNGWALLKYNDCVHALSNPDLKAERMANVLKAKFPNQHLPTDSIYYSFTSNVMMYTDGKKHENLRKSTHAGFTHTAHEHYNQVIEKVALDLVESLPQSRIEIDAVTELVSKLPIQSSVQAFGLPEEDLDFVVPRVNRIMTYWSGPKEQPLELKILLDDLTDLHTYSLELVQGKRGKVLADTVIHRLALAQSTNILSTPEQTIHQLVLLLVALFAPTTPGSVSSGTLAFAQNPDQIDLFLNNKSAFSNVSNEVVRYNASNQFTWRTASKDIEYGGVVIKEGQSVIPFLGAANRDPEIFNEPNKFLLSRENSNKHLSFGIGVHSCLGKQIASMQIQWFFAALLKKYPKITLAGEPIWNENLEFRSLKSLPLRLR